MKNLLGGVLVVIAALVSSEASAGLISDVQANTGNRCGDNQIPVSECPSYQAYAYNNGAGCITHSEYLFAISNAVAPMCSILNRTVYIGWCRCGCFEEGTGILTENKSNGEEEIVNVEDIERVCRTHDAVTLSPLASFDEFFFESHSIIATTVGPEDKPLVVIVTEDGRRLGVTEQHAILVATGEMLPAVDLTTDHEVVDQSGAVLRIASIERVYTSSDVYNFLTDADLDPYGHLVVAEGLVVGDIMWQNTLASMLGEVLVRE